MRKINFDLEQFLKETIGEDAMQELGLSVVKEEMDLSSKEISKEDKSKIFISHSEWKKLKLPLPVF